MKERMITLQTAKKAKPKGFYYRSEGNYFTTRKNDMAMCYKPGDEKHFPCCTQSALQKWLRDKYKIDITVITEWKKNKRYYRVGLSFINSKNEIDLWLSRRADNVTLIDYAKYEDALEVGLKYALGKI